MVAAQKMFTNYKWFHVQIVCIYIHLFSCIHDNTSWPTFGLYQRNCNKVLNFRISKQRSYKSMIDTSLRWLLNRVFGINDDHWFPVNNERMSEEHKQTAASWLPFFISISHIILNFDTNIKLKKYSMKRARATFETIPLYISILRPWGDGVSSAGDQTLGEFTQWFAWATASLQEQKYCDSLKARGDRTTKILGIAFILSLTGPKSWSHSLLDRETRWTSPCCNQDWWISLGSLFVLPCSIHQFAEPTALKVFHDFSPRFWGSKREAHSARFSCLRKGRCVAKIRMFQQPKKTQKN